MPERALRPPVELPPPSAELILWRASMQAFIAVSGRKRGERFLRTVAEKLALEDNLSSVFQIRPTSETGAVQKARREAAEIYERYLPILLAQLPRD
jgi:hypothetical protein